jgi:hypothetical protein
VIQITWCQVIDSNMPAGSKVFVGLDNRTQAGVGVIIYAFDSEGNMSYKVFEALMLFGVTPRYLITYLLHEGMKN